jgi:regulator of protease activity HflC (stomatin/prohibitin superfamily)
MTITRHDNFQAFDPNRLERITPGRRITVQPWERALLVRGGMLVTVLDPGTHRVWTRNTAIRRVDTRHWIVVVPAQEVATADGVSVKVSAVGRARIVDPATAVLVNQNASGAVHVAIQQSVRQVAGTATVDELVSERVAIAAKLQAAVDVDGTGIELSALELRDVVLPADLKRAQAQVLLARAEGHAALERARGETAALRALANAARLAADNPALYQLRLLQHIGNSSGHTLVVSQGPA